MSKFSCIGRPALLFVGAVVGGLAIGCGVDQRGTTNDTEADIDRKQACVDEAAAFTDYPLVWAGPSVLGYTLVHCSHAMSQTRHDEQGRVSHPGGDSWAFGYGTCTTREGQESCPLPVTIVIDPCALTVDGRVIPRASQPVRSITVRGAKGDISRDGVLTFEQSPQIIQIYAPEGVPADERAANAVLIAEALVPVNAPASAAASAVSPDALLSATLKATKVACP